MCTYISVIIAHFGSFILWYMSEMSLTEKRNIHVVGTIQAPYRNSKIIKHINIAQRVSVYICNIYNPRAFEHVTY